MIARNRPEATLREIVRAAAFGADDAAAQSIFFRVLRDSLQLRGDVMLAPSGRAAIYYLLSAIPLERVYLPAYTCWVVLEAARLANKEVVLLDIDYPRLNIRLSEIERIRGMPGIVIATHQFGFPEDVGAIQERLRGSKHVVIEDCAGAMFTRVSGAPVGSLGDAALYSFETSKLWTLGRGGLIVTPNAELATRVKHAMRVTRPAGAWMDLFRLGMRRFVTAPFVYHWLLAAYLLAREPTEGMGQASASLTADYLRQLSPGQLRLGVRLSDRVGDIVRRRQALFELYDRAVADMPGIERVEALPHSVVTPIRYPVLVKGVDKRRVYDRVRGQGIDLGFSYSYTLGDRRTYPGAAKFAEQVLNLPLYGDITDAEAQRAVAALRAALT